MRIIIFISLIFTCFGCFTSYQNTVTAVLQFDNSDNQVAIDSSLFMMVHSIATKNHLHYDTLKSEIGNSIGFYGSPYHYFTFTVSDSSTKATRVVQFIHDARLSSGEHNYEESEYMFIDSLNANYRNNIKDISIKRKP